MINACEDFSRTQSPTAAGAGPALSSYDSAVVNLRKSDEWHEVATASWRMLAVGYAVVAAWFTVLPWEISMAPLSIDVDQLIATRTIARAAMIVAAAAAVMLALMAWRHRRNWRSRLSWPVGAWLGVCLGGLGLMVLLGRLPGLFERHGLAWFADLSQDFDVLHVRAYVGFALVVALAWRDRLSLPMIGLLLVAYSLVLELAQEFAPTRGFGIKDLVSNSLGISIGLSWIYLYDLLLDSKVRLTRGTGSGTSADARTGAAAARAPTRDARGVGNP